MNTLKISQKRIKNALVNMKSFKSEAFRDALFLTLSKHYDDFEEYSVFTCADFFSQIEELDLIQVFTDTFLEKGDYEVINQSKKAIRVIEETISTIIKRVSIYDLKQTSYEHCEIIMNDLSERGNHSEQAKMVAEKMLFERLTLQEK